MVFVYSKYLISSLVKAPLAPYSDLPVLVSWLPLEGSLADGSLA